MELFGVPLETVYLYGLIIFGGLTFLFILFNDIFSGLELPDIFNPTLIFCFLTVFFASGFLLESLSGLNAGLCAGISLIISFTIVTLLNVFVLIPISSAEESLTFHDNDLRGRVGRVLTSIPVDGFGEVLIESISGSIAKTAASYKNEFFLFFFIIRNKSLDGVIGIDT
ncbi:hypothetical protein ACSS6N_15295 [Peribacillus frigoritolerans]|uniref:hypothetical protein n=1 Tax=Peribacillus frigoritolerans TaxID=450367 RepID=UPI003F85D814